MLAATDGVLVVLGSEAARATDCSRTSHECPGWWHRPGPKRWALVIETAVLETPQLDGPYGARGVGEHPMISVAPAIGNAIGQSTGAQLMHMPIRAEDVWRRMRDMGPIDNWITKSPTGHCRSTRLIGDDRVPEGTCGVPSPKPTAGPGPEGLHD